MADVVRIGERRLKTRIRRALIDDVDDIHRLINKYAQSGRMLKRPLAKLFTELRDFSVVEDSEGELVGVGALHILWRDLAEIRAIAVAPELIGKGIGGRLVRHLLEEARHLGVKRVCLLTNNSEFFTTCGFERIEKYGVPHKLFSECIFCDRYENCDEEAMIQYMVPASEIEDVPVLHKIKADSALMGD